MKKILAIAVATLPLTGFAGEMALDLQFDEDGKATPVSTYGHDWTDSLYSQVKYRSLAITEMDTSTVLSNSATTLNEQFVQLSLIGYKQEIGELNWSVGGGVELIRIENREFGFGPVGADTLVIENNVEITSTRALLTAQIGYNTENFSVKSGIDIKPAGNLSVKQDTSIEYTTSFSGGEDDSHSTDLAYGLLLDGIGFTGLGFDIGFGAEYSLLPLKYDLAQSNSSVDGFDTVTIEQDETTTRYSLRIILGKETDMGRPMFGVTNETLSVESGGQTSEETINYLVLGFDKRF